MRSFRPSAIKLIIFDLDGTLIDAYGAIESSLNFTLARLGLPEQKPDLIKRAVGWGDRRLVAPFVPAYLLTRALKIYRRHHKGALRRRAKLFPGARSLLSILSARYKLAVASNRPSAFSKLLLETLNIDKYFDFVLCADRLKKGKPHPLILKSIMAHFGLCSAQTIYIGDMAIDAQTARRAKVKAILVTTGSSSLREIRKEKPYRIISSIGQLEGVFKK